MFPTPVLVLCKKHASDNVPCVICADCCHRGVLSFVHEAAAIHLSADVAERSTLLTPDPCMLLHQTQPAEHFQTVKFTVIAALLQLWTLQHSDATEAAHFGTL